MPKFEKLTPEEARKYRPHTRRADLAPYVQYLETLEPGEFGKVQLDPDDKKPTIKNRLTRASRAADRPIKYRRGSASTIVFEVIGADGHAAGA
ncbi:MAG TPA: hypothetical protein VMU89_15585 [Thermomicrobiaceae bacterium]|nr:hypothetical protein [Thermomicrobiaceae bacterium]